MKTCRSCNENIETAESGNSRFPITAGICSACRNSLSRLRDAGAYKSILDSIDEPLLLMQPDPRQVYAANRKAAAVFGKDLSAIEGHRGGEVFDCIHSFTEAGCGKDVNCENCKIKNAVVETFASGVPVNNVSMFLEIKKRDSINAYLLEVSTERVGELALLRIDRYEMKPASVNDRKN